MELCFICTENSIYLCSACKIYLCRKHKGTHEKRKIHAHNYSNSGLCVPSNQLKLLLSKKISSISPRLTSCPPFSSSTQEIFNIREWYKQEYPNSLNKQKSFNFMKRKYLKYISEQAQIFVKGHTNGIRSVLITSDSQYIISISTGKSIRIWNFQHNRQEAALKGHTDSVSCIAITSDNNYLVSGSKDKTLIIWNLQAKTQESILRGHRSDVYSVYITSDSRYIISTSGDHTFRIWDFNKKLQEFVNGKR